MVDRLIRLVVASVLLGALAAAPALAQVPERIRVFIGFDRNPGAAEEAVVRAQGGAIRYTYDIVPAVAASVPENAIAALLANPRVTRIEPVRAIQAVGHMEDTGVAELEAVWGVEHIGSGVAHGISTGDGVVVAVIDSGIDDLHPDLASNYIDGYDFVNDDNDPYDDNSHGTHVAGTIAASSNSIGVVGVGSDAGLIALKVLDAGGSGSFDDVVAALDWIVGYNANNAADAPDIRVTNNSYGAAGDPGQTVEDAFDAAFGAGILHIAAAGNSGKRGPFNTMIYPARFSSVVAVAATDEADQRASFSSVGDEMELAAPGVSINSTLPGGGYGLKSGTSMASPHVAGVAALVFSLDTGQSPQDVRNILLNSADDIGASGWDRETGHGLVDADGAIGADLPVGDPNSAPTASFEFTCTDLMCDFDGRNSTDSDGSISNYDWKFGDGATGSGVTVSHAYSDGGVYSVMLTVTDNDGATGSDSQNVTVSSSGGVADITVSGIDPNSVPSGVSWGVTISGNGFDEGANVTLENGSGPAPSVSNVAVSPDGTWITATITTKSGGPPRNRVWDVRVTNPNASTDVLEGGFTVTP